jgi:hypothetical protein
MHTANATATDKRCCMNQQKICNSNPMRPWSECKVLGSAQRCTKAFRQTSNKPHWCSVNCLEDLPDTPDACALGEGVGDAGDGDDDDAAGGAPGGGEAEPAVLRRHS